MHYVEFPSVRHQRESESVCCRSRSARFHQEEYQDQEVRHLQFLIFKKVYSRISFEDFMSAFEFDQNQKLDVSSEQSTSAENIVDRVTAQGKSEKTMDLKLTGQKMAWILTEAMTIGEEGTFFTFSG